MNLDFNDLTSGQAYSARQFSMMCFDIMGYFHWTYDEVMELPLPVLYALMDYFQHRNKK